MRCGRGGAVQFSAARAIVAPMKRMWAAKNARDRGTNRFMAWSVLEGRRGKCAVLIAYPRKTALKGAVSVCGR